MRRALALSPLGRLTQERLQLRMRRSRFATFSSYSEIESQEKQSSYAYRPTVPSRLWKEPPIPGELLPLWWK